MSGAALQERRRFRVSLKQHSNRRPSALAVRLENEFLMIGERRIHYRIVEKIGPGGMGLVHKARVTSLDRFVLTMDLPNDFSKKAERLARFKRHAKIFASVSRPNIAILHVFEEPNRKCFIAMQLIEGRTQRE